MREPTPPPQISYEAACQASALPAPDSCPVLTWFAVVCGGVPAHAAMACGRRARKAAAAGRGGRSAGLDKGRWPVRCCGGPGSLLACPLSLVGGHREGSLVKSGAAPRWGPGPAGVAYRDGAGCCCSSTATLIYAYRDRSPVTGRMVPLTPDENRGCGRRSDGDRSCHGERPGTPPAHGGSGGHLGPHEPGELAGDCGGRLGRGLPAAGRGPVPGVQPALRLLGPGQGAGVRAGLPAPQRRPDRGSVLVGPGGLGQRGAHRLPRPW